MRTTGKKGKGKWIVIVVIAVFIIAAASNSGNDDTKDESKKVGSVTESSGSTSKDKKKNKSSSKDKNSNKKKSNKSSKNNGKTDDNRFHPGDVVEFGDFEIAYMGAEKYKSNNQFIQPKDGYKYVKFYFTFKNTGNSDSYPGSFGCYVNNKNMIRNILTVQMKAFCCRKFQGDER